MEGHSRTPREVCFHHDGLALAGRLWGESGPRIMALHGWLDNAASFDAICSGLGNTQVFALDLPGHGLSDHKPPSGNYAIWDDLRSVLGVADALGWDRFTVLGHSRGAMMATLLGAAVPERIAGVVCLDGLAAIPMPQADFPIQLGRYLREYGAQAGKTSSYPSLEKAAKARIRAMPMQMGSALKIVERGTVLGDDGQYYWRSDRRLSMASPVKLSKSQWQAAMALSVPALFLYARQGMGGQLLELFPQLGQHYEIAAIDGDHHFHMDIGAADTIAQIHGFLAKNQGF